MLIAVMSDSHDNIWNLREAQEIIKERAAEMIIHCGDFIAPFMLSELQNSGIPVHGVFGNNDGEVYKMTTFSLTTHTNIFLHGHIGKIEAQGISIAFTHHEDVAEGLAYTGRYDLVCFGHTHEYSEIKTGNTILLNPGEVMGKSGIPGFCLVDTKSLMVERILLTPRKV